MSLSSGSCSSPSSSTERKSADFSISVILSNETGGSSSRKGVRERRTSSGTLISPPGSSPPTAPMSTPSRYKAHQHPSLRFTPFTTAAAPTSQCAVPFNQSLSSSPFNISLLLPSSSPDSGSEGLEVGKTEGGGEGFSCNDSLGMLSTVALYHSELSGAGEGTGVGDEEERGRGRTGAIATSIGDGVAQMRLESSCDTADTTVSVTDDRSTPPPPPSPSYRASTSRGTPFILKRDRKRRRQLMESFAASEITKTAPNPRITLQPPSHSATHTEHSSAAPLDTGFLSPTSTRYSPRNTNLSFSPSIFLSRPADSNASTPTNRSVNMDTTVSSGTLPASDGVERGGVVGSDDRGTSRGDVKRNNEETAQHSLSNTDSSTVQALMFATSTPIKHNKENAQTSGLQLSPARPSPSKSGSENKRPRLRDSTTYETSSGSDSDVPVKKCRSRSRALRRRNKACTQLSPLLENACSPIAKTDHRPPSSLLTATTLSTSARISPPNTKEPPTKISPQYTQPHHFPITPTTPHLPVSIPFLPPPVPFLCNPLAPPQYPTLLPPQPNLYLSTMPIVPTSPLFPLPGSPLSPPQTSYIIPPRPPVISSAAMTTAAAGLLQPPNSLCYYATPQLAYGYPPTCRTATATLARNAGHKWGGSPLSAQWEKTGQIQSVPPWFIFEQNRPEGKRLRLTEAINRSLSETPSHNPRLPAGWTKYACGQTDDQIMLTQNARQFLQSGRRQLTFENINT